MPRALQVSIGVPVFNGERFLARTLTSLLDQTLVDIEVVVSDNASTDGTREICADFARRDPRVRYVRQPVNVGAARNWNMVVHEAQGEFFKWSSASDIIPRQALERCVDVLRSDPETVLCYGRTQFIDDQEQPLEQTDDSDIDVSDELASARFARVCTAFRRNNAQCGVFRIDVLRRTRLDRPYPSGDMSLMAELALYGKFRLLPEVLLLRRGSREVFTAMLSPLERQRIYDPNAVRPLKLIRARRHWDHAVSIWRASISPAEKLRAYKFAMKLTWWDRAALRRELQSLLH
jgi:glycosyltransferase involved in cell wall biosynthesis